MRTSFVAAKLIFPPLQNSLPCLQTQNVKLLLQGKRLQLSDKTCLLVQTCIFPVTNLVYW